MDLGCYERTIIKVFYPIKPLVFGTQGLFVFRGLLQTVDSADSKSASYGFESLVPYNTPRWRNWINALVLEISGLKTLRVRVPCSVLLALSHANGTATTLKMSDFLGSNPRRET